MHLLSYFRDSCSTHSPKSRSQEVVIGKEKSQCEADRMKNRCHQSSSTCKGLEDKGQLSYLYFRHHQPATSVALGPPGRPQELYHDTGYGSYRSILEESLWSAEQSQGEANVSTGSWLSENRNFIASHHLPWWDLIINSLWQKVKELGNCSGVRMKY